MKFSKQQITIVFVVFIALFNIAIAQNDTLNNTQNNNRSPFSSYKDRLVDYADIYSYEIDPNTQDTLLFIRKINDY